MKKGIAIGETVIFILGVLVFAMIILFGYKSVGELKEKEEQTQLIRFKAELKNDIGKLSKDYGSVEIKEYEIPREYKEICFIDKDNENDFEVRAPKDSLVRNAVESKVKENILLVSDSGPESFESQHIKLEQVLKCYEINGRLKLRLEGKGGSTLIE